MSGQQDGNARDAAAQPTDTPARPPPAADLSTRSSGYLALLRSNRAVRRVIIASGISGIGDSLNWIAILLVLTRIEHSYDALGMIVIMHTGLPVVLAPFAGALADRLDRRTVMFVCDFVRVFVVLGFIPATHAENSTLVWVLVFIQYAIAAVYTPAAEALMQQLPAESEVKTANALFTTLLTGSAAAGSMIGGLVVAVSGIESAFVIDALSFLSSGLLVMNIVEKRSGVLQATAAAAPTKSTLTLWSQLRREPRLGTSMLADAGVGIPGGLLWLVVVDLGQRVTPLGADGALSVGIFNGLSWIAAMIGSAVFNRWLAGDEDIDQVRGALRLTVVRCASLIAVGLAPHVASTGGLYVGLVFSGVAISCFSLPGGALWVAGANIAQAFAPDAVRGRMFALLNAIWTGSQALTVFLATRAIRQGATLSDVSLVIAGVIAAMVVAWVGVLKRWPTWSVPPEHDA